MTIEAPEFRRILGHWPTGVAVVAARAADGRPRGLTANAITSLSLDPPLVLVCVDRAAETHAGIIESGAFAISILPDGAEDLARRFADERSADKFAGVEHRTERSGSPVLDRALAWIDCGLHSSHEGGDHTIFIGRVLAAGASPGAPLLFYRGGYGRAAR